MECQQENTVNILQMLKSLPLRISLKLRKSNLYLHAKCEFDKVLELCKDDKDSYKMQKKLNKNMLKTVDAFCSFGHSGGTAEYAIYNLWRVLRYLPITPLQNTSEEWVNEHEDNVRKVLVFQNKRYSGLFKLVSKETGEVTYNLIDANGRRKQNTKIKFPYIVDDGLVKDSPDDMVYRMYYYHFINDDMKDINKDTVEDFKKWLSVKIDEVLMGGKK